MTKHSAVIRLQNARAARDVAWRSCVHADIDGYSDYGEHGPSDCCYALDEAERTFRAARTAYRKQVQP